LSTEGRALPAVNGAADAGPFANANVAKAAAMTRRIFFISFSLDLLCLAVFLFVNDRRHPNPNKDVETWRRIDIFFKLN
jgi:hypothetical protein